MYIYGENCVTRNTFCIQFIYYLYLLVKIRVHYSWSIKSCVRSVHCSNIVTIITMILTLSVPGMIVIAWVNSFPRHALCTNARLERAEESCWLTINGRYAMLGFVGKGFSWEIQILNRYSNSLGSWNIGTGSERVNGEHITLTQLFWI